MILTLDVSAAMEIVLGRPKQLELCTMLLEADWVIAPSLFKYEASNVMWKYRSFYGIDTLVRKARQTVALVDEYIPSDSIYEEAIALACKTEHPAYDSMYLIVCRRRHATLVTLDSKLRKLASDLEIPFALLA